MKLKVSPLVLAAALGLVGPAALDEGEEAGISGLWKRAGDDGEKNSASLGNQLEVLTIEDRVLLGDGRGELESAPGSWEVTPDLLVQHVELDGARITRQFTTNEQGLVIDTAVEKDGQTERRSDVYERVG